MHAGAEKPFARAASALSISHMGGQEMPEELTPKQIGSTEFKWWADEIAGNLKAAVDTSAGAHEELLSPKNSAAQDMMVNMITRRICRQIAKQIPGSVYSECVGSLRNKLKVVEDACGPANWDTVSMSSASVDGYYTPSDTSTNGSGMSGTELSCAWPCYISFMPS